MFVYGEGDTNRLSPRFCTEVKEYIVAAAVGWLI